MIFFIKELLKNFYSSIIIIIYINYFLLKDFSVFISGNIRYVKKHKKYYNSIFFINHSKIKTKMILPTAYIS